MEKVFTRGDLHFDFELTVLKGAENVPMSPESGRCRAWRKVESRINAEAYAGSDFRDYRFSEGLRDSKVPRFRAAHSSLSVSLIKKEVRVFELSNWVPRGSPCRNKIIELVSKKGES